jgi:hypothetical protein
MTLERIVELETIGFVWEVRHPKIMTPSGASSNSGVMP